MIRPRTAPDPSQLTACVLDCRLRAKARRLRVSPNGLHRPATAPPSGAAASPVSTTNSPVAPGCRRGSSGSSLAEVMVIEEDVQGAISDIEPLPNAHTSSDHQHSTAWLDGAELAAINGASQQIDDDLHRMKETLTAQLAGANENDLSTEQQRAIEHALAGLVGLEHQLHPPEQQDGSPAASTDGLAHPGNSSAVCSWTLFR